MKCIKQGIYTFSAEDVKTHNSSRGSSPSGDASEDLLKDRQQSKLDELLKGFDVDEKVLRNYAFCL